MSSHATLGAALAATGIATRNDRSGRRNFAPYRAENFASGLTVLLMIGAAAYVAIEGISRVGQHAEVATGAVMVVGTMGLVVNIVALLLLRGGAGESLNVKGTGIAMAIAAFVAIRALILRREVLAVLGQHAPRGMAPTDVEDALGAVNGVAEVHDLHLWTLTPGRDVATAHLVGRPEADSATVLESAQRVLREQFRIEHATLQIETGTRLPRDVVVSPA